MIYSGSSGTCSAHEGSLFSLLLKRSASSSYAVCLVLKIFDFKREASGASSCFSIKGVEPGKASYWTKGYYYVYLGVLIEISCLGGLKS